MSTFEFPTEYALDSIFRRHLGDPLQHGWRIRMRHNFGYFTPEAWYQAAVDRLVTHGCRWIDVGGGKSIFPHDRPLSCELASRCGYLVGVDPSDNLDQNDLVNERCKGLIEEYHSDEPFDLATFRMVAEHIQEPEKVIESLARLVKPAGHVVIYTPNKWSLVSIAASLIPDRLHAGLARLMTPDRLDEDVFPTSYKMNTRKQLQSLFQQGGFEEVSFSYLEDCVVFQRFQLTCFLELAVWKTFRMMGITYPENNLLGIYRKK